MRRNGNNGGFGIFAIMAIYYIIKTLIYIITNFPIILLIFIIPVFLYGLYLILKRYYTSAKAELIVFAISSILVFIFCTTFFLVSTTNLSIAQSLLLLFSPIIVIGLFLIIRRIINILENNNIYLFKSSTIKKYSGKLFSPNDIPKDRDFPGIYLIVNRTKNIFYIGHTNNPTSLLDAKRQFLIMNTNNCIFEDYKYGKNIFSIIFFPFKNERYDKECATIKKVLETKSKKYVSVIAPEDEELFFEIINNPAKERLNNAQIRTILNKIDTRYVELNKINKDFQSLNLTPTNKTEEFIYTAASKREFDKFDYRYYFNEKIQDNIFKYKLIVDNEQKWKQAIKKYLNNYSHIPEPLTYEILDKYDISLAKYSELLPQKIQLEIYGFKMIVNVFYETPAGKNRYNKSYTIWTEDIEDFINGDVFISPQKSYSTNSHKKLLDFYEISNKWFPVETVEHYKNNYQDFKGVYVLYNNSKQKYYVGQSVNVLHRVHNHFNDNGCQDAYLDFLRGDKFTVRLMPIETSNFNSLNEFERIMIAHYNAYYKGYNKTRGNYGY